MTATFSTAASEDLRKIGAWTYEIWGENQLEVYEGHLVNLVEAINSDPLSPMSHVAIEGVSDVRGRHIRSIFRRGRHVAYYRLTKSGVHILRVLHDQMLAAHHLTGFEE